MLLNITYVQGVSFVNTTATDFYNSYSKSRLFTCGGLTGGYVGFLSPSVGNSDAQVILYQALKLKPKPMFGPDTVSNFMYDPTSRDVIHFNVPADIEAGQLFYYSMHSSMQFHEHVDSICRRTSQGAGEVCCQQPEHPTSIGKV